MGARPSTSSRRPWRTGAGRAGRRSRPCTRRTGAARRPGRPRGRSSGGRPRRRPSPRAAACPARRRADGDEGGAARGLVDGERRASGARDGPGHRVGAEDAARGTRGPVASTAGATAVATATSPASARRSVNQPSGPQVNDACWAKAASPYRRAACTRPGKALVEARLRDAAAGVGRGDGGGGLLDPGNGPAVEASVGDGVHVVEQVGNPDDGLAAVLGEEGHVGEQLADPPAGADGVERGEAEGDDLSRCTAAGRATGSSTRRRTDGQRSRLGAHRAGAPGRALLGAAARRRRSRRAPTAAGRPGTTSCCAAPLLAAMRRLNPLVPGEYLEQALAEIVAPKSQDAIAENFRLHQILVRRLPRASATSTPTGSSRTRRSGSSSHRVEDNELLAVNQVTIRSTEVRAPVRRRALPQRPAGGDRRAEERRARSTPTIASAHAQLATYLREFPMAFRFCVLTIITDGITARYGTPFTPLNHYSPWNVDDDGASRQARHRRGRRPDRRRAGAPHRRASATRSGSCSSSATSSPSTRARTATRSGSPSRTSTSPSPRPSAPRSRRSRATARPASSGTPRARASRWRWSSTPTLVARQPKLKNPTLVVVTDRTELDSQLFETFNRSQLLAESPINVDQPRRSCATS